MTAERSFIRTAFIGAFLALGGCGSKSGDEAGTGGDGSSEDSGPGETGSADGSTESTASADGTDEGSSGNADDSTGASEDWQVIPLRVDAFNVPVVETYYACFEFTFTLDKLGHIVGFNPHIDNAAVVHHFVLTILDGPTGQQNGYSCFDLAGDFTYGWAPGQGEYLMPETAGFLIGDQPGGQVTLRLQVHYNNPLNTPGHVDSSGVDLYVTDELRPNHAGSIVFGDVEGIEIPPGQEAYEHVMTCRSAVTQAQFSGPLQVFGTSMHAHEIGSVLWSEVWRDGEVLMEMNRDDPFDFNAQNLKYIEFEMLPGDEIRNHCIYDSTNRTETTMGGPGTRDEMCWNTILYYPKLANGFDMCTSFH